jgi:endoglucanase
MPSPTLPSSGIFERNYRLGRAVNLGNALDAPNEGEWGVTLQEEYFSLIRGVGFNSVRIPIRFAAHAAEESPYTIDAKFLERVDWAVNNALAQGLAAIMDMHYYDEMMADPAGNEARFLALWGQIADHYKDYSNDVYFELLNEPNGQLGGELWNRIVAETITVIRKTNPTRPIVVGPGEWYGLFQLDYLNLPVDDPNIIVSFHYYQPFQFTHQGAEWVQGSDAWLGTKWTGDTIARNQIRSDLRYAAIWGQSNNRPIFLGEFGAYSKADTASRLLWTDAVARQAEELGISWAYWEFCSSFGVYDPSQEVWREGLLKALIPGQ